MSEPNWWETTFMTGKWTRRELTLLQQLVPEMEVSIQTNLSLSLTHLDWLEAQHVTYA